MSTPPITPPNTTTATAPMVNAVPVPDPALLAFCTWAWLDLLVPWIELSPGAESFEEPDVFGLPDEFDWLGWESLPLLPVPAAGAGVIPTPKRGAAWLPDEADEPEDPEPDCPEPPPPAFRPWSTGVEYCFAAGLPGVAVTPSCEPEPL